MVEVGGPHPRTLRWHCPHCLVSFTLFEGVEHCSLAHDSCLSCSAERLLLRALASAAMQPGTDGGPIVFWSEPLPGM